MSKYIDETSCPECDDYQRPYGCMNSECPIRIDYDQEGMEEMAADKECDRLREERWENERNQSN